MPIKPVDPAALLRAVGPIPRRYPKGDPRNLLRERWYNRATAALAALLQTSKKHPGQPSILTKVKALAARSASLSIKATDHTLSDVDHTSLRGGRK